MTINDAVLQRSEKTLFALRELYTARGYRPYRMSKFEPYDLYARNKEFLLSDHVITFTDTDGTLMALKPDVTISIIKNSRDLPDQIQKVFYNENVYRVSKGTGSFQEIMQAGVEWFGVVDETAVCEVLRLAAESLRLLAGRVVLAVADLDLLECVIQPLGLAEDQKKQLYQAMEERNGHEVEAVCADCTDRERVEVLKRLLTMHGPITEVLPELERVFCDAGGDTWMRFRSVLERLATSEVAELVQFDGSVTGDVNYYNGIVFKGFVEGVPNVVLSGGQYDRLMRKLHRRSNAIGFAVYTDALERMEPDGSAQNGLLSVALPKGRLGEKVYNLFASAGFDCPSILEPNRKLIFENAEKGVRFFWVKPSDVAIYVERGAADIGVAGKDILLEYEPDIYELLDLNEGKCRMAVAAPKGFTDDDARTLRVATKFARIARKFYQAQGREIDIIHLNGSIEIAPILGLSDVIVDIVETGITLRENQLEVVDTVAPISARLIANKTAYRFKGEQIERVLKGLSAVVEDRT